MSDINWDETRFDFAITHIMHNEYNKLIDFLLEKPELINGFYIAIDSNSFNRQYNSLFWTLCERPKKEDVEIIYKNNTCDMSCEISQPVFYNSETIGYSTGYKSVKLTQGEMDQIMTGAKVYPGIIDIPNVKIQVDKVWQKPPELKPTYTKAMHEAGELPPVGFVFPYCWEFENEKEFNYLHEELGWEFDDELELLKIIEDSDGVKVLIVLNTQDDVLNCAQITRSDFFIKPIKTDEEVAYEDFMENRHVLGTTEPLFHAGSKFAQSKNAENIKRAYDNGKKEGSEDKESLILKNLLDEYAITGTDFYRLIVSKIKTRN